MKQSKNPMQVFSFRPVLLFYDNPVSLEHFGFYFEGFTYSLLTLTVLFLICVCKSVSS